MPKKREILAKESTTKKNQEKLAEKARERMKRLRDHAHNALWVMYIILFLPLFRTEKL